MIIIYLQDLVYIISDLINLFLSGFIFITLYNWLTNTQMELYFIGIWSLFINSLIKTFYSALHSIVFTNIDFNESLKVLIYVITAVILSIVAVKIHDSSHFKNILNKIHKKTVNVDILNDVIDYDKKTMMVVYPKNSDRYIIGTFRLHEEKGSESYIALIDYILCNKCDDSIIRKCEKQKTSIVINLRDVERIELFYEDDSEKWQWLKK